MRLIIEYSLVFLFLSNCGGFAWMKNHDQRTHEENIILTGRLGIYKSQLVMQLNLNENKVEGIYYYSKHRKKLLLSGVRNPINGEIEMVETYRKDTTGYFRGQLNDSILSGHWSVNKNFRDNILLRLNRLDIDSEPVVLLRNQTQYVNTADREIYNSLNNTWDPQLTKSFVYINKINPRYFDFYIKVRGHNGHIGSIDGLVRMISESIATFRIEENCELLFKFDDDSVKIEQRGCWSYHGAKASFNNRYL